MKNKTYNILKWVAIVFIPALVALISSIGLAVGCDMTIATAIIGACGTFLATLLGVSSINYYNKGGLKNDKN